MFVAAVVLLCCPTKRILDLLLLLLDQELFHGVVLVMFLFQQHELPLLLQHRPMPAPPRSFVLTTALAHVCVVIVAAAALLQRLPLLERLPVDAALVHVLVVPGLVPRVVDADHAAVDGRAAQVVDGEVGAALVLVLEPAEAARLARLLVAGELEEGRLAVLREDGDDVTLAELVWEPAEVDKRRVTIVDMPGGVGGAVGRSRLLACACPEVVWSVSWVCGGSDVHSLLYLPLVELLDCPYLVHGRWRRGCAPPPLGSGKYGVVVKAAARLGDFQVTSVRLKGLEVAPVFSGKGPLPTADLQPDLLAIGGNKIGDYVSYSDSSTLYIIPRSSSRHCP